MKEFEGKATWRVSEWGEEYPDRVTVRTPNGVRYDVRHEDEIGHFIPGAPDELKAYGRSEVLRCRSRMRSKLRAWTGAQLAKRKVTFETDTRLHTIVIPDNVPRGLVRVTIEPIE